MTVAITRSAQQSQCLTRKIHELGANTVAFPVLEIAPPQDSRRIKEVLKRLGEFDIAVYISGNAVSWALHLTRELGLKIPVKMEVAAVGARTADALEREGLSVAICPDGQYNSEALLAMTQMQQIAGKKIIIFRGEGGRELLADTLRQRGADVEYAEVYRRVKPNASLSQLQNREAIDLFTISSNESLNNLYEMASDSDSRGWLLNTQLAVISQRTVECARKLGFKYLPLVAKVASDEGLVTTISEWYRSKHYKDRGSFEGYPYE
ncbi:MAG: uroporphyrinogen-III synthase [Gammaproteobacteria bacterium]|nr:uroporphyrinogen-III synthase [Gammaproteobacteria bacterium]